MTEQDAPFPGAFPVEDAKEEVMLQSGGSSDFARRNTVCHEVPANVLSGATGDSLAGRPLCAVGLTSLVPLAGARPLTGMLPNFRVPLFRWHFAQQCLTMSDALQPCSFTPCG